MHRLPVSLGFFVATGVVFLLQLFPLTGIVLMFMLAMFWSVLLINAGMVGVAIEAALGRVSRLWLLLPILFYGGYYAAAATDHARLASLQAAVAVANERVHVPFDPTRQALLFERSEGGSDAAWLTQNYAIPVAFERSGDATKSTRLIAQPVCARVAAIRGLMQAGITTFGFHDNRGGRYPQFEKRFCTLTMPEAPGRPIVRVASQVDTVSLGTLPVRRLTTTVTTPDGHRHVLQGGTASPLSWWPMPVMGCGLNSGAPSWGCDWGFWRSSFTPLVTGTRYRGDAEVLAGTLSLRRVAPADRQGADAAPVLARVTAFEQAELARQLAAIDGMAADPVNARAEWFLGIAEAHPEALAPRGDAIVAGLERAVAASGRTRYSARDSGRILARLVTRLPRDQFIGYGPRLLALYRLAGDDDWMWDTEELIRRLGDLGPAALPVLVRSRAMSGNVNGAGIEGLCRVGALGRAGSEPVLLARWSATTGFDRDQRQALFVALRRIGATPPPLADDRRGDYARLLKEWADITPASPPRVCATRAEEQARREEKYGGRRRSNLD